jgi:hypothetical protein
MKDTVFVKVGVDLHCEWEGIPPDYRIYVDGELFCERTYSWSFPQFLTEILQIDVIPNKEYRIQLEKFGPQIGDFTFKNCNVEYCEFPVEFIKCKKNNFKFKVKNED